MYSIHDAFIIAFANVGGMYKILFPIRDKWKYIGLKLGLFPATLEDMSSFIMGEQTSIYIQY